MDKRVSKALERAADKMLKQTEPKVPDQAKSNSKYSLSSDKYATSFSKKEAKDKKR